MSAPNRLSAGEQAREFFDEHVFNAKEFPDLPIENSITMRAFLAGHAAGLAEAGELVEALERVAQHHWFDGKLKESNGIACGMCDMGDAGEAVNTADGHDLQCPVSIAHWTLARFKALAGE